MTWRTRSKERLAGIATRMWTKRRAGSAAIEFAFVAPVLFVFLCGILEVALLFLSDLVLQNATNNAAREIRTGQVTLANTDQGAFKDLICGQINSLMPECKTNLLIDVQAFNNFNAVTLTSPLKSDGSLDTTLLNNWDTGTACSIVLVRAFYTWPILTPLMTPILANVSGKFHLLYAAAAFRNEPYNNQVTGC